MKIDLTFLRSNRFWSLVLFALSFLLGKIGVFDAVTTNTLLTLFGGFIGIRTIDRFAEKIGNK